MVGWRGGGGLVWWWVGVVGWRGVVGFHVGFKGFSIGCGEGCGWFCAGCFRVGGFLAGWLSAVAVLVVCLLVGFLLLVGFVLVVCFLAGWLAAGCLWCWALCRVVLVSCLPVSCRVVLVSV
ncbi:hypothetical protein [Streptomyces sp. NPDC059452]|uniref:hypothetical protein n=1 Tax=Streptomyces sp. NPDC059452 TaxID=3346835 RepID=UPI0036748E60